MTKEKKLDFRSEQGFTLMELIVVIGVIGILIAILLPQFNGYTDKANAVSAKANAKTALTSISAYKTEVDTSNVKWDDADALKAAYKSLGGVAGTNGGKPDGIKIIINNGANGTASMEVEKGTLTFTTTLDIARGQLGRTKCAGNQIRCKALQDAKVVDDAPI